MTHRVYGRFYGRQFFRWSIFGSQWEWTRAHAGNVMSLWCCIVFYCVVLCCIMLYCVVLCCVVLCCVVLSFSLPYSFSLLPSAFSTLLSSLSHPLNFPSFPFSLTLPSSSPLTSSPLLSSPRLWIKQTTCSTPGHSATSISSSVSIA